MGSLTNYGETALVQHVIGEATFNPPATLYLALLTATATETSTGATLSEVANSNNYARAAIAFSAAATRKVDQNGVVTFNQASGSWNTVTDWAIVDGNTHGAGNVYAFGSFAASKSIVINNTPSIASGDVFVQLDAVTNLGLSNYAAHGLLDLMFRDQTFTIAGTYLAVTTATISDSDTGSTITEPSGNGYARLALNIPSGGAPQWATESGGATSNADAWSLGPASGGSWGTLTSGAICDASGTGNLLMYDNVNVVDQLVGDGDTVRFDTGQFDFSIS